MSVVKFVVRLFVVVVLFCSCVPAKKYYEIESANRYYKNRVEVDSLKVTNLTAVNGSQMMKIMSLSEDSIRLHYRFDSLFNTFQHTSQVNKLQIANVKRELKNRDLEVTLIEERSQEIIYSFRLFDVESNIIYRQLSRYMYKHIKQGVKIDKTYWSVVVTLPIDYAFDDCKGKKLTASAKSIINRIVSLVGEHPKYHIDIVEYSRPVVESIEMDSVVVSVKKDTLQYFIDSTAVDIEYEYPGFEVVKREVEFQIPASMRYGTAVSQYIESLKLTDKVPYSGVVYTYIPKGVDAPKVDKSSIMIVIYPKITSVLRDIATLQ